MCKYAETDSEASHEVLRYHDVLCLHTKDFDQRVNDLSMGVQVMQLLLCNNTSTLNPGYIVDIVETPYQHAKPVFQQDTQMSKLFSWSLKGQQ